MKTTWLILLGLLLLTAPAAVQAQYGYSTNTDGSIYTYSTNADGSINFAGYVGPPWTVVIPTNINGQTVTSIGPSAFSGSTIANVTIPGTITNIGFNAFYYCSILTSVTISPGVTSIGDSMFQGCGNLSNVTIPGTVTMIGSDAFEGCGSLTSLAIPGGVTAIGDYAFDYCSGLTNVTIPGSVTWIGQAAFAFCSSLASVYFTGNPPYVTPVWPTAYVFKYDNEATVYYLPGTAGWGSPFGGVPAVLWNPMIQTGGNSFGLRNSQFGFNITYTNNVSVVVETCTNLACPVWLPLRTVTLTNGSFYFSEPVQGSISERFYGLGLP